MSGYIQRLFARTQSMPNVAMHQRGVQTAKASGRLSAPLVEFDQRLMTGSESISEIELFLEGQSNIDGGREMNGSDKFSAILPPLTPQAHTDVSAPVPTVSYTHLTLPTTPYV